MNIIEISLVVQDLSLIEVDILMTTIKNLGGTANGKVKIVSLESGEVEKALFVLNNVVSEQLFKEGSDNGHDDDGVSGSAPAIQPGCGCDHCDCTPDDPDVIVGDDVGYSYPNA